MLLRFRPLGRSLRAVAAARETQARGALGGAASVPRSHVELVLAQTSADRAIAAGGGALTLEELLAEKQLRDEASTRGARLPLEALAEIAELDEYEREIVVLCAAATLDAEYERVFAYAQDDAERRYVTIELACALTASSFEQRVTRRLALSEHGRLRRLGLLAVVPRDNAREELRLTSACLEALLGASVDLALVFHDPASVTLARPKVVPCDPHLVERAAELVATRAVGVVGIWGRPRLARDVVGELVHQAGVRVRRYPVAGVDPSTAAATASALGAVLWIDLDAIGDSIPAELVDVCRRTRVQILLTGLHAFRPTELVAARDFVELEVVELDPAQRAHAWQAAGAIESPAFRFDALEIIAAARMARATAALETNGTPLTAAACLAKACAAVARKHGQRHTTLVIPRRGAEDLILLPELHTRVLELAHYFRALPRVMDEWGFGSRTSGAGIKALFTGDPGTGKTLAAEVVAHEIGLPILKVDLARVVSKWIGETEKHLDGAFNEAKESHAVLFFDEAEALFGARGEVRHGTDRYANLEVSYLLQRLEEHAGVVILATNLRDKIDPAFMRRFQAVIGFPRPAERERRQIWQRVFTPALPVEEDLDLGSLARLDLTGAGIVGAAQTAAFAAAREDLPVGMRHIVHGLVRQFQREARVLSVHELGPHAKYLETPLRDGA